jgi:O-antigen ligase
MSLSGPASTSDLYVAMSAKNFDSVATETAAMPRLLGQIIFTGLLLLVLLTPLPYGAVEAWWVAAFECAAFALAGLWVIDWLCTGRLLSRAYLPLLAPLCALALYAFVQSVPLWPRQTPLGVIRQAISFDPYETRLDAVRLLALTLVLALLLRYTDSARRLRALVYTVIGGGLVCAVFGLVRQVAQRGANGFLLAGLRTGTGYAQFINKNHFAFLVELSLGLLVGLIVGRGVSRQRIPVYVALAVPLWAALVLSNSRGGVLAMLCQAIFLVLCFNLRPRAQRTEAAHAGRARGRAGTVIIRLALALALVLSIFVGMIWVGGDPLAERLGGVREELGAEVADTSQTGRTGIWRATWRLCLAHPLVGVGFGGYWMAITEYHDGSGALVPQQAHNDYLELWASGGLVGLALAGWFIYSLIRRARQQLTDPDPFRRAVALGALTGLFGVAVHSLVDFGLHLTGIALIAVSLVALATVRLESAGLSLSSQKTTL